MKRKLKLLTWKEAREIANSDPDKFICSNCDYANIYGISESIWKQLEYAKLSTKSDPDKWPVLSVWHDGSNWQIPKELVRFLDEGDQVNSLRDHLVD